MLQGLRTVIYGVADIETAKNWYAAALGFAPYFDEPFYAGFNVGGYELGLDPNARPVSKASAGVVAYWGVDNIAAEYQRLLALGAKAHTAVREVGGGISVATVLDPFGNIIGLIHNPHFKLPST
ncbi:MAG: VOC family protein [Gammaproteobacteria bacterium]|nr:VOC family protein [Gammaproteobacteria bacterium]